LLIVCRPGLEAEDLARLEQVLLATPYVFRWARRGGRLVLHLEQARADQPESAALLGDPAIDYVLRDPSETEIARIFSRRSLLHVALGGTGVLAAAVVGGPIAMFLASTAGERSLEGDLFIGRLEQIPVNGARTQLVDGEEIIFIRREEDRVQALSATCTHSEACLLNWDGTRRRLVCPCHRGVFDANGNVVSGPPPRPLQPHQVVLRDGSIYLRRGRK